jgi:hypothetical protein
MRMTEARIYFSIVTAMKATGYPECEALTAHPLAWFSKRCDGRAEVRRADERSESGSNELLADVPYASTFDPRPIPDPYQASRRRSSFIQKYPPRHPTAATRSNWRTLRC